MFLLYALIRKISFFSKREALRVVRRSTAERNASFPLSSLYK